MFRVLTRRGQRALLWPSASAETTTRWTPRVAAQLCTVSPAVATAANPHAATTLRASIHTTSASANTTATAASVRRPATAHPRMFSTESGDKPMTAAEAKAAFLAKQKAAAGGQQWAKFSGSKAESTLSPEERAKLAAEQASTATATATATNTATAAAADGTTAAASDTAAAGATVAAPSKPRKPLLKRIKDEVRFASEYLNRTATTASGLQKRRLKPDEDVAALLKLKPVSNMEANDKETALVFVEQKRTVWEDRFDGMKDWFRASAPMRGGRKVKHVLQTSENPLIERSRAAHQRLQEQIEDWRNVYDESQHPLVWKVRELQDKISTETDMAFSLGQIQKLDPTFDVERFLKDMEAYMIPRVIDGYLKPDAPLLRLVTESNAARVMAGSLKEREVQGYYWDRRVLDLHSVELTDATVIKDTPILIISFVCQHVNCVKDKSGKVVDGFESDIKTAYYRWAVRRDFENPFFDWKIVEFVAQRIQMLV